MVVASTLSFLTMNNCLDKVTQGDLVEMARDNERIVGVNSGGMDVGPPCSSISNQSEDASLIRCSLGQQAASVLTTPSSAIYITFFPKLSAEKVQVPKSARFVIAVRPNMVSFPACLPFADPPASTRTRSRRTTFSTLERSTTTSASSSHLSRRSSSPST